MSNYLYESVEDYEQCTGEKAHNSFRLGWRMARTEKPAPVDDAGLYKLFAHLSEAHGLTCTDSELYEIIRISKEVKL